MNEKDLDALLEEVSFGAWSRYKKEFSEKFTCSKCGKTDFKVAFTSLPPHDIICHACIALTIVISP